MDVIVGSIIGSQCAVTGIIISNKTNWCSWIGKKKFFPVFMLFMVICAVVIIERLFSYKLFIFYASLLFIVITLYLLVKAYVKK